MRLAVHQPNYVPWCGYFAKMRLADVFLFLDDAEVSTAQSYFYRSRFRGPAGETWLSVPTHRGLHEPIGNVRCADRQWPVKHLNKLAAYYRSCPFFAEVYSLVEPLYREAGERLADFNIQVIRTLADYVGIDCRFERTSALGVDDHGDDRHIALARAVSADRYVSGQGATKYQDPAKFAAAGLMLEVHAYEPIPYKQIHGEFVGGLSFLDALFHLGRGAAKLLVYPALGVGRSAGG